MKLAFTQAYAHFQTTLPLYALIHIALIHIQSQTALTHPPLDREAGDTAHLPAHTYPP
ncbi:hypothetical protein KIM372_02030 [Bombiscardovia nodaiensis]|uniref:Uncharacterized protein n=1 Tax=Bombiscardovia nodaiensis TaxID=2932181 RepID=A0ABN6SBV7_9BIFI|nr:hypothetical protein KIM372_02030 [Bombiscardovia nodaiensis]